MNENFPYKDIIDLPHHQAEGRKHMSLYDRAAQFSAFAALSGYDDIIAETGRLTSNKIELPEDIQDELDRKFALLISMTNEGYRPDVTVSYFVPDKTKEGGSYESYTGDIKRIETTSKQLIFYDKEKDLTGKIIDIGMIKSFESNLFDKMM
jgi:hypothetical protein